MIRLLHINRGTRAVLQLQHSHWSPEVAFVYLLGNLLGPASTLCALHDMRNSCYPHNILEVEVFLLWATRQLWEEWEAIHWSGKRFTFTFTFAFISHSACCKGLISYMKCVCSSIHQKWPRCHTLPTNFQGGQPYIHTVPVLDTFFNAVPTILLSLSDDSRVMWCDV